MFQDVKDSLEKYHICGNLTIEILVDLGGWVDMYKYQ